MAAKYRLTTLGCKVNQYDSQRLRELLETLGLRPARDQERADLCVVNTCAVTATALSKSRRAVRQMVRSSNAPVIVVGCGASADADSLKRINGVHAILGHDADWATELRRLVGQQLNQRPTLRNKGVYGETEPVPASRNDGWMMPLAPPHTPPKRQRPSTRSTRLIIPPSHARVKLGQALTERISRFDGRERAFLKVQDGCDAGCTYCIVPRLRGPVRSKPIAVAVAEAERLVGSGHKEIVITGVYLGAFGHDTALRRRQGLRIPGTSLPELVGALARIPGLVRLRLSSLEPGDVDDALLEVLAAHENCVPHLHLPLQSGSDRILRRMNRQYTRTEYLRMVDRVRSVLDRPAITTDIIAGFPGETDEDMDATISVARHAGFCKIHAFPFSPRPGTAAARWQREFVLKKTVRARMARLAEVERQGSVAFRSSLVGSRERVIIEQVLDAEGLEHLPVPGSEPRASARAISPDSTDVRQHENLCTKTESPKTPNIKANTARGGATVICCGRSDRYFQIHLEHGVHSDSPAPRPGDVVDVRIDRVTTTRTYGTCAGLIHPGGAVDQDTALAVLHG